jgi:hypothetical protein
MRRAIQAIGRRKAAATAALLVIGVTVMGSSPAMAACLAGEPCEAIGDAAETVKNQMVEVAVLVLPFAALILVLALGWRYARRFLRG